MYFFLDVERRRLDDESDQSCWSLPRQTKLRVADRGLAGFDERAHLLGGEADASAVPDDLRVEVCVSRAGLAFGQGPGARVDSRREAGDRFLGLGEALQLGGGDVPAQGLVMLSASTDLVVLRAGPRASPDLAQEGGVVRGCGVL